MQTAAALAAWLDDAPRVSPEDPRGLITDLAAALVKTVAVVTEER